MNDIQMKQLEQTLTSMEVAEMVEKTHANMLRDIKRYCKQMEQNNITKCRRKAPCFSNGDIRRLLLLN